MGHILPTLQPHPEISLENGHAVVLFKGSESRDMIPASPIVHFDTFSALPV